MRNLFVLLFLFVASCNNESSNTSKESDSTTVEKKSKESSGSGGPGACGKLYVFKKGAVVETASYDGAGKETTRQRSTVLSVSNEGGRMSSEVEMKTIENGTGQAFTGNYSCDGKNLYIDLSSIFANMSDKSAQIEGDAITFPIDITEGQTLPDGSYTLKMNQGGAPMTVVSTIKDRKVSGRQNVTTAAGDFNCYVVSATIEADIQMPDADEQTKAVMEAMKKKRPKQTMVMYFDPEVSVVKAEIFSDGKLISRSEVVSIKE